LNLARISGVLEELEEGELLLGDLGYVGEKTLLTPIKKKPGTSLTEEEQAANQIFSRIRIKVENTLAKVKVFEALKNPWRQEIHLHPIAWNIACQTTNIKIEYGI
jgi:hypothetical protein